MKRGLITSLCLLYMWSYLNYCMKSKCLSSGHLNRGSEGGGDELELKRELLGEP